MKKPPDKTSSTALILSGGGARGAYEAGVLKYVREELPPRVRARMRFDIVCGTSVGAVNSCFFAAFNHMPEVQGQALVQIWKNLRIDGIYHIGMREILNFPKFLFGSRGRGELDDVIGSSRLGGLFNTSPLEDLVRRQVRWKNIQSNLTSGDLKALALTATHVSTGATHVFIQRLKSEELNWDLDSQVIPYEVQIGPSHVLASAAIPWLFPAVEIEGEVYCDGGLKLNTPISPALRLGADRLFLISLRPSRTASVPKKPFKIDRYPSALFLLGKILNALTLDKTDDDLRRLERFNALVDLKIKSIPYRHLDNLVLRPSEDLGLVASRRLKIGGLAERAGGLVGRLLSRMAESVDDQGADVLSYLLFDAEYANDLIELGMHDADAQRQKIIDFFN